MKRPPISNLFEYSNKQMPRRSATRLDYVCITVLGVLCILLPISIIMILNYNIDGATLVGSSLGAVQTMNVGVYTMLFAIVLFICMKMWYGGSHQSRLYRLLMFVIMLVMFTGTVMLIGGGSTWYGNYKGGDSKRVKTLYSVIMITGAFGIIFLGLYQLYVLTTRKKLF